MSKYGKLLQQVLCGTLDANIAFDDSCQILIRIGFQERINLRREGDKAYQVRQVREVFATYDLGEGL